MHFHLILSHLVASTTSTTVKGSTTKSSSYLPLLILVGLFGVGYVLFIRPRSQRMRQQQQAQRQLAVGDEVMSAGGIYGKVVALDSDQVEVEVSPGVVLTFIRRAVSLRQPPPAAPPARGGFFGARPPARGASAAAPAEPVDDPWDVEPDGPGDTAGEHSGPDHEPGKPDEPGRPGTSEG